MKVNSGKINNPEECISKSLTSYSQRFLTKVEVDYSMPRVIVIDDDDASGGGG